MCLNKDFFIFFPIEIKRARLWQSTMSNSIKIFQYEGIMNVADRV